jgi:hypothetical protein
MNNVSRRQFMQLAAAAAGGVLLSRSTAAWSATSPDVAIVPPLSVFGYAQVQLLESPLRRQFEQNLR